MTKGKIYCFINGGSYGWFDVQALSEEGHFITGHISSTVDFAKHDIGLTSNWKHELYEKYYPDGYGLLWVDDPENNEELNEAYRKHCAFTKEEYKKTYNERLGEGYNQPEVTVVM